MQPEVWARIEKVFQAAIEAPEDERPAFVSAACGDNVELRCEVESLLAAARDATFTKESGFADAIRILEQREAKRTEGRRIGAYRILREIGHGGMGNVYQGARADDVFQKFVAIKIIRRGFDSDALVQRFHEERRILARLEHPNIARLLDGGTSDDGLPYFVMEYVEGESIDVYCDRHNLTVTDRLKLFEGLCAAVHYVHQNLVIHRDLKPGNVLVTKEGVARLLDFGIAKLMEQGAGGDHTVTSLRPFTLEFASPEQIRGDPVTTASDVYSLGVLLYLLLTGHSPYGVRFSSPVEMERAICERDPERPSIAVTKQSGTAEAPVSPERVARTRQTTPEKLRRRLQGDLDNVVLMALRKEPQRRYPSAEQLGDDIRRHLATLPVKARRDTRAYRAGKFVRRNRIGVSAALLLLVTLTAGIFGILWQARVARQQRDLALHQLELARVEQAKSSRINTFLQEMVGYSAVTGESLKNRYDATVAEMLDDAAQRVETELDDLPAVKAELLQTIGTTYMVQAKIAPAERYLREAYELNSKVHGAEGLETAVVMMSLASLAYRKSDFAGAEKWFDHGIQIYRRHLRDESFALRLFVGGLSDAAFGKRAMGKPDEAVALWREAASYAPQLPPEFRFMGFAAKSYIAQVALDRGDAIQADELASAGVKGLREFGTNRFALAQALIDLGNARRLQVRYEEAESLIREGTELYAQLQGDHPNVAYGLVSLAGVHFYESKYGLAEKDARRALKIIEKLPKGTIYYANVYEVLGRIYVRTGRFRDGERLLREALAIRQNAFRSSDSAFAQGLLGECLLAQKRYAEAEPLLTASYRTLGSTQVPQSPTLQEARDRLNALYAAWRTPR